MVNETSLNKYDLLQTESQEVKDIYKDVSDTLAGSLTTVLDNDASAKFLIAIQELNPTQEQRCALEVLQSQFHYMETEIDPDRLNFFISKGTDDEVNLNRRSDLGLTTLIIHDDGSIAHSFIALPYSGKPDLLDFQEDPDSIDWEETAFKFFQW